MKRIFFVILSAFILLILNKTILTSSEVQTTNSMIFKFDDSLNDVYNIKGTSEIKFFRNNTLHTNSLTEWESKQKAISKTDKGIKFSYSYLSKKGDRILKQGDGEFIRNQIGEMFVDENIFYPQSINMPVFSEKPIAILNSWTNECSEIIDFRNIGIQNPFILKSNVKYTYLRNESINNEQIAVIRAFYIVNTNTQIAITGNQRNQLEPSRLIGYFERIFFWNIKKSFWQKMDATINFILTFSNALTVEFHSIVKANMEKISK